MYVAEGPSMRPQPCLKRGAEGSSAGGDADSPGNVVLLLIFIFFIFISSL